MLSTRKKRAADFSAALLPLNYLLLCQPIAICQNLPNLPRLQPKPKKGSG